MTEPTWHPVRVPPLRRDLDRQSREYRRALARIARTGWFAVAATLGFLVGTLAAMQPENFV